MRFLTGRATFFLSASMILGGFGAGCCPKAHVVPAVEAVDPTPTEPEAPEPDVVDEEVPVPEAPEAVDVTAVEELPETGTRHAITPFSKTFTVAPGDILTHTFEQHGSVGKTGAANVADPSIVALLRHDVIYKNPQQMEAGAAGGDAASATFVFKALKKGTTQITIQHLFRGTVEHTVTVDVVVQ